VQGLTPLIKIAKTVNLLIINNSNIYFLENNMKKRAIFYSLLSLMLGLSIQTQPMDFLNGISKAINYIAPSAVFWGGYYTYTSVLFNLSSSNEENLNFTNHTNQNNNPHDNSANREQTDKLIQIYVQSVMKNANYPEELKKQISFDYNKPGNGPFAGTSSVSLPINYMDSLLLFSPTKLEACFDKKTISEINNYRNDANKFIDETAEKYKLDRDTAQKALELAGISPTGPKLDAALCHEIGHVHNNHIMKLNLAPLAAWGCVELASRILTFSPAGTYMQSYPSFTTAAKLACALIGSTAYFHFAEYQADHEVIQRIKSPQRLRHFGDQLVATETLNNKIIEHDYPLTAPIRTRLPSLTHPSAKNRAQRLYKAADKYEKVERFKFISSGASFNFTTKSIRQNINQRLD
jgi:hypothetical protein